MNSGVSVNSDVVAPDADLGSESAAYDSFLWRVRSCENSVREKSGEVIADEFKYVHDRARDKRSRIVEAL